MTDAQALAIAAPILMLVAAFGYTLFVVSQKPPPRPEPAEFTGADMRRFEAHITAAAEKIAGPRQQRPESPRTPASGVEEALRVDFGAGGQGGAERKIR